MISLQVSSLGPRRGEKGALPEVWDGPPIWVNLVDSPGGARIGPALGSGVLRLAVGSAVGSEAGSNVAVGAPCRMPSVLGGGGDPGRPDFRSRTTAPLGGVKPFALSLVLLQELLRAPIVATSFPAVGARGPRDVVTSCSADTASALACMIGDIRAALQSREKEGKVAATPRV